MREMCERCARDVRDVRDVRELVARSDRNTASYLTKKLLKQNRFSLQLGVCSHHKHAYKMNCRSGLFLEAVVDRFITIFQVVEGLIVVKLFKRGKKERERERDRERERETEREEKKVR